MYFKFQTNTGSSPVYQIQNKETIPCTGKTGLQIRNQDIIEMLTEDFYQSEMKNNGHSHS